MLQKTVTSRTGNNECRMDWRCVVRHLKLSSQSGNHCSVLQRPVLKFKVALGIFALNFKRS